MKKVLSVLLAVSMLLAMGSGMVLFGANAEMAKMSFEGLNGYTLDEANSFGADPDGGFPTFSEQDGKIVINITNAVNLGYNRVARFSTGDKYDQWRMNFLVGDRSFFGDIDLSNKLGFKFKVVNTGAAGTVPYTGKISLTFGSSTRKVALDWKDIPQDSTGYYTVDWSIIGDAAHGFVGEGWYMDCPTIESTYFGIIDQLQFNFSGVAGESYSFYLDDFHAFGNADTVELGIILQEAIALGAVESGIIAAAEAVYKDTKSTQAKVDEQVEILNAVMEEAIGGYEAAKETLNELLNDADALDYFNPDSPNFDAASDADYVYSSDDSTLSEVREQIAIIRLLIAAETMDAELYDVFEKAINVWEYNYVKSTYNQLTLAIDAAWEIYADDAAGAAALIEEAYAGLVPANISVNTGNFFEGWTTEDVNAVFESNPLNGESSNYADSIGNGLNEDDVWNSGDFSNNTTFEADDNFSMTANVDFIDGSMGWKNLDRSTSLSGAKNGAFPAMNVAGLSESDGIRFKLDVDGSAERILIGLSNCSDTVREMYALKIKPEYVTADGYINIPFSYFEAAWWCDPFAQDELESVIVFIIEAYNVTSGTTVTVSDLTGYISLGAASASLKAKLAEAVDTLEAFDIDGRHADLIAEARALNDDNFDLDYEKAYEEVQALIEGYGIPDNAIIDVPGFSIYSQEELDLITGLSGNNVFTKTERGFKYTHAPADWAFTNGIYIAGTGYDDSYNFDALFGAHTAINGKTFIDMLGGYKLADIYAYRFMVDNPVPGKGMSIHYKDAVGLWSGMFTNKHEAYLGDDGYFTYYTDEVPEGPNGGWYGEDVNVKENILNNTVFVCCEFFENQNKEIYGWQVILYETLDRSPLKEALEAYADFEIEGYKEAMEVYYDTEATEQDIADAVDALAAAAVPAAPEAPVASKVTDTSVTLVAGPKSLEYRLGEDGEWTSGCVFEGLEPNTEYNFYARVRANGIIPASEASEPLTVTTLKTAMVGEAFIEGDAVYGETLTVYAEMNALEYVITWHIGDKVVSDQREYTITKEDIGSTVYVVLSSDSFSGSVTSSATPIIEKATPVISVEPDAVNVFLGEALADVEITGAQVNVEGTWAWETPEVIPTYEQNGSTFTAIFTPADTDCYEVVYAEVTVNVDADTEYASIYDADTGITLSGEFARNKDVETAFGDILPGESAYLAVLRAARDSEAANNLILFKNLDLNVENAYVGTLELTAFVGADRAGQDYTLWYFADGEVRSASGYVDADGTLCISEVIA